MHIPENDQFPKSDVKIQFLTPKFLTDRVIGTDFEFMNNQQLTATHPILLEIASHRQQTSTSNWFDSKSFMILNYSWKQI